MKIKKGRDAKKAVSDGLKKGTIRIISSDGKKDTPAICEICDKYIGDVLDSYAYHCINDDNYVDVEEKCFCTRRCWNEYLKKEASKI